MKRRTITFTKPTGKSERFYADKRMPILDAVESTLSDATGKLYIKYSKDHKEFLDDVDKLLYLIETWLLTQQRGTMDAGLVYLVGSKRYALDAATIEQDVITTNMQTLQRANKKR